MVGFRHGYIFTEMSTLVLFSPFPFLLVYQLLKIFHFLNHLLQGFIIVEIWGYRSFSGYSLFKMGEVVLIRSPLPLISFTMFAKVAVPVMLSGKKWHYSNYFLQLRDFKQWQARTSAGTHNSRIIKSFWGWFKKWKDSQELINEGEKTNQQNQNK